MELLSLPFSPSGRTSPRTFAFAVVLMYVASCASQMLLASPVTTRAGLVPFIVVQLILLWVWVALHAKRLHDAGRSGGLAVGIGLLYALGIVLLLLLVELMVGTTTQVNGAETSGATFLQFFVILALFGAFGDPNLGAFGVWLMGILALIFTPMLIALAFSIWAGTRTRVALAP
jgi:uncharacterized membrane protein YhaH (DUF805 family)